MFKHAGEAPLKKQATSEVLTFPPAPRTSLDPLQAELLVESSGLFPSNSLPNRSVCTFNLGVFMDTSLLPLDVPDASIIYLRCLGPTPPTLLYAMLSSGFEYALTISKTNCLQ